MRSRALLIIAALAASAAFLPAKPFEGVLTYEIRQGGEPQEITFTVKGPKMAFQTPVAGGGKVLLDRDSEKATVLMPEQRMYMEVPAQRVAENVGKTPSGTFEVTDETREILGYTTRKVIYTDGAERSELWITDEVGSFQPVDGPLAGEIPAALKEAFPDGGMPLEVKSAGPDGSMTMTVVDLEEKTLPDSEFEVPAGYRPLNMGGMQLPGMGQ
jgi:hypothetical protein